MEGWVKGKRKWIMHRCYMTQWKKFRGAQRQAYLPLGASGKQTRRRRSSVIFGLCKTGIFSLHFPIFLILLIWWRKWGSWRRLSRRIGWIWWVLVRQRRGKENKKESKGWEKGVRSMKGLLRKEASLWYEDRKQKQMHEEHAGIKSILQSKSKK